MKQRTLLFLLVLLSTLTASAYDAEIDGIYYNLNASTMEAEVVPPGSTRYTGSVKIPESITYEDVTYSVTSIGDRAFRNCSDLTSVIIPNSVTEIRSGTFQGCTSLTSITIPDGVMSIGNSSFYGCFSLELVIIGNNVTSIGKHAFDNCQSLKSVTIGKSVTSIGESAFALCFSLTSMTIGNSVTSIGERAFQMCEGLKDVYCYAESIPTTDEHTFDGAALPSATLHVPASSLETYKATSPWSGFSTIIALTDEEMPVKGINSKDVVIEKVYNLSGRQLRQGRKGVNILRYGNGKARKVLVK